MYDIIIIGGGIIGTVTARELSKYALKILLIECGTDIAIGATKANSGILHAGYDCIPGTLKARLNVKGSIMYPGLCNELDIPYRTNGSLVIATNQNDQARLQILYKQGLENGVASMEILSSNDVYALEPNLSSNITGALRAKTAGIISPYEAGIAFGESAAINGVEFLLETKVKNIKADGKNGYVLQAISQNNRHCKSAKNEKTFRSRIIINAAGVSSADINNHISPLKEEIVPWRGQYYILDNTQKNLVNHTIFQLPTNLGKGVLVVPTIDHNILLGPTAEAPENPHATATTAESLHDILVKTKQILKTVPIHDRITTYAGIRAKHSSKDFVLEEATPGFINAIGIDSPGLTAAPAIAEYITEMATKRLQPALNPNFNPVRIGITSFRELSQADQVAAIKGNQAYGRVICRCETITEAEILDAIHRPIGAKNLDAIKRRTRAQMGRCQGGFCKLRIVELLSQELGIPLTDVTKDGVGSEIMPIQL